ncbi:MAG: hypothetical protein QF921_11745 [Pseudomonadales bacterium]|mgnify:CR=1 FL=1|jgi:hypothetical protein|nr:hypothetical protein [Pseudomonadales bacterium]MDP6470529.1 hypothetical protein [Pseudomonadales bacterium]MDP6827831.1 hypothetical protein [Pseudomonadales bacterium]MDP6972163.1 hypothetical protein [Pseudomonadales bacterium]
MKCKPFVNQGADALMGMSLGFSGAVRAAVGPCSDPGHRQFDSWVGRWRVETADGTHTGNNNITVSESGCLVTEHWQGPGAVWVAA